MRGEFGSKLKEIKISQPFYRKEEGIPYFDLMLIDENNEHLYVCGENDIPHLLQEALKTYYKNKKKGDKKC